MSDFVPLNEIHTRPASLTPAMWRYHQVHKTRLALLVDQETHQVLDLLILDGILPVEIEQKLRMAIIGRNHAFIVSFLARLNSEVVELEPAQQAPGSQSAAS